MRFSRVFSIVLLAVFLIVGGSWAQEATTGQSNIGLGLNLGVQKLYSDIQHTGLGPAGEAMAKFLVNNRFNISLAVGYGLLNDGFIKNTFQTNLVTGDLKVNVNLLSPGRVNPYVSIGLGVFSFHYQRTDPTRTDRTPSYKSRFYDGSFILGGGLEVMATEQLGLNFFADYRHTTGDELDGKNGGDKDGYVNGRAGFVYYLSPQPYSPVPAEEDLMALERVELNEMEDLGLPEGAEENLAVFEARLDKLEANETGFSMEQYVRLKSRVDELNQLIAEKEAALEDLRMNLDLKNQRIADLEAELARRSQAGAAAGSGYIGGSGFSASYDEALRAYYARDYETAIAIFQDLKDRYPQHKLASNCQYWIGECYFGMGDYSRAAEAFQAVFNYPSSYKKDDATIMLGRCYYNMNDFASAKSYFEDLLNTYPDSEYVDKARMWLGRIG